VFLLKHASNLGQQRYQCLPPAMFIRHEKSSELYVVMADNQIWHVLMYWKSSGD